jgi:tryptophanyl-tRNA synthetase
MTVRGRKVSAEARIPAALVEKRLHTSPQRMEEYWQMSAVGGVLSGTMGVQGHLANGLAAMYLACGLDPARCEIFVQSHVPAHSQLCWILETLTPMGWLDRMTQFKARSQAQGRERINTGVFTYPVLMAADILLYDADFVPVGEDQRQHIELCRDLAQRLNSQRGDVLKVPAPLIGAVGARVMGLDTPDEKMSKSIARDRPGHAVMLLDPPDTVRKKIARATTDTEPAVHAPVGPGVANLLEIYAALAGIGTDVALHEFEGKTYGAL